jgi:hypothetical protein
VVLIPEIAALPDAMAQAGDGADEGGVVSQHIFRKWRAVPARHDLSSYSTGETPVLPVCLMGRPAGSPLRLFNLILFGYVMSCAKDLNIFGY